MKSMTIMDAMNSLYFKGSSSISLHRRHSRLCGRSLWEVLRCKPRSTPIARRKKLPVATHPVWTSIGDARSGLKLGYRKGARGGVWVGKLVTDGARVETTLGPADDAGTGMSYAEAAQAMISWAGKERQRLTLKSATTTRTATRPSPTRLRAYVRMRVARAKRAGRDAQTRLARHVLSDAKLAPMPVGRVTARSLSDWRSRLPATMTPAGVNRLLNDLRAALNAHVAAHWRDLPPTVGKEIEAGLKALPNAQTARQALLSDSDVRRVIDAAYGVDPDLGALVLCSPAPALASRRPRRSRSRTFSPRRAA